MDTGYKYVISVFRLDEMTRYPWRTFSQSHVNLLSDRSGGPSYVTIRLIHFDSRIIKRVT
jgi:hypothetical protein